MIFLFLHGPHLATNSPVLTIRPLLSRKLSALLSKFSSRSGMSRLEKKLEKSKNFRTRTEKIKNSAKFKFKKNLKLIHTAHRQPPRTPSAVWWCPQSLPPLCRSARASSDRTAHAAGRAAVGAARMPPAIGQARDVPNLLGAENVSEFFEKFLKIFGNFRF